MIKVATNPKSVSNAWCNTRYLCRGYLFLKIIICDIGYLKVDLGVYRDVWNKLLKFFVRIWFGVWKNSDSVGMILVRFMQFKNNAAQFRYFIVSYYSCNNWVVNLQQILQRQWMTWLWCHWHHSQQQQQVNNVIAF